jgi:hypothetical protein
MTLETDEVLIVLRALYFYEDKLANTDSQYKNVEEHDQVMRLRRQMGNLLKIKARID